MLVQLFHLKEKFIILNSFEFVIFFLNSRTMSLFFVKALFSAAITSAILLGIIFLTKLLDSPVSQVKMVFFFHEDNSPWNSSRK